MTSRQRVGSGKMAGAKFFWCCAVLAMLFCLAHAISLPLAVSYDGLVYLHLADVLGSPQFPEGWQTDRTPLFPLVLKLGLLLFGRYAESLVAVLTLVGVATILMVGTATRLVVGAAHGGIAMVLLALYPTFVAYQHQVLTEVGTGFFLALVVAILVWPYDAPWRRTAALILAFTVGYFWRQPLLSLTPLAALLHALDARHADTWHGWRPRATLGLQAVLIISVPFLISMTWKHTHDRAVKDVTLRQGIMRQALPSVDHPILGPYADEYRQAIAISQREGNFYSGMRADLHGELILKVFNRPSVRKRPVPEVFAELVLDNPVRYAQGVIRSFLLFGGATAFQNDNFSARNAVFSHAPINARISGGHPTFSGRYQTEFGVPARDSLVLEAIKKPVPLYDALVVLASLTTLVGLAASLWFRNLPLFTFCAIPLAFVCFHAMVLASIDRYAFPAYPLAIANLIVVPTFVWNHIRNRRRTSLTA